MGLMDVLNGMMNGPRGARQPEPAGKSGGGMSPLLIALLGLLAYKAMKGSGQPSAPASPAPTPSTPTSSGGGIGDILGQVLGGRTSAGAGASPGGGGIGDILGQVLGGGRSPAGSSASPGSLGGTAGLNDIFKSVFGGAAGGALVSGGLANIVRDLQATGQGAVADSWVGNGPNQNISPNDLARAVGADEIAALSAETGLPPDQLLQQLSDELPEFVNQLTPEGRVPTADEAGRWV